jgi:hypothetical protein
MKYAYASLGTAAMFCFCFSTLQPVVSFGPLNNCLPRVPIQFTLLPVLDPHCLRILSYVIFPSDLQSSYWSTSKWLPFIDSCGIFPYGLTILVVRT